MAQSRPRRCRRSAYTLVELLVAIAIVGLLVALSLAGIQKVRASAVKLQSENKLRQLALGLHHYAQRNDGMLPGWQTDGTESRADRSADARHAPVLGRLLPYLEGASSDPESAVQPGATPGSQTTIRLRGKAVFMSPADPSLADLPVVGDTTGLASYSANMAGFVGGHTLRDVADGLSSTIAFSERYARTGLIAEAPLPRVSFTYHVTFESTDPLHNDPRYPYSRRGTFADRGWKDVYPILANGVTRASVPGKTFQVRPKPEEADASVVQTPFAGGLPVAMFDGSVRTISPGVSEAVFWSAVTPAGGETAPLD